MKPLIIIFLLAAFLKNYPMEQSNHYNIPVDDNFFNQGYHSGSERNLRTKRSKISARSASTSSSSHSNASISELNSDEEQPITQSNNNDTIVDYLLTLIHICPQELFPQYKEIFKHNLEKLKSKNKEEYNFITQFTTKKHFIDEQIEQKALISRAKNIAQMLLVKSIIDLQRSNDLEIKKHIKSRNMATIGISCELIVLCILLASGLSTLLTLC